MNENSYLTRYYENHDEDGRLRTKLGNVEFLTTMRFVERYLKPGDRIIEIGAGTGRYSHALAQRGYHVDAVELIQHNVDVFIANTLPGEDVSVTLGDALDLSGFEDESFNIVLLLGPMYHLYTVEHQERALSEALRMAKQGGILFAAYCGNDASIVQACFQRGMIRMAIDKRLVDPVTFRASSTPEEVFQLHRKEDIDRLMEGLPVKRLHFIGTDMASQYIADAVDAMDDETYETYLRYHFSICERPDMVGVSHHLLDVFQKAKD